MVETRMDVMISRLAAQSQPVNNPPRRPASEKVVQARPAAGARSVETDIARIFAKRAFQATPSTETRPVASPSAGRAEVVWTFSPNLFSASPLTAGNCPVRAEYANLSL